MSAERANRVRVLAFNLPNRLTGLRLILAVVMFCLIPWGLRATYLASMVLFILAAATDWLDGYLARKRGEITALGRILDPFADKVIICGTFIFLVATPKMLQTDFGLRAWMVVVIVGRELLVTLVRSFLEERGSEFSAKMSGKLKMVLQCVTAGVGLFYLSFVDQPPGSPTWVWWLLVASIWVTVALTVYSGLVYIQAAVKLLRGRY